MPEVYVGIGSNVEPDEHVAAALRELAAEFGELDVSPVYRNPAVGFEGDDFLNLVVGLRTDYAVDLLVERLREIERRCGRERTEARWGPRTLDLDLLLYGAEVRESPPIPRADVLRRAFVLCPLSEIAGGLKHPVTGRTFAEHWASFEGSREGLEQVKWQEPAAADRSKA